jgi:hypothetical protein
MVFKFYSDELVMCDDTRPQWPLRALSRCVETLAAWNCGQNCPLIRAQKPLYQYFPTGSMTRACYISDLTLSPDLQICIVTLCHIYIRRGSPTPTLQEFANDKELRTRNAHHPNKK